MLCLPDHPTWGNYTDGLDGYKGYIYGVEIDMIEPSHIFDHIVNEQDQPCVVCHTVYAVTHMFPGRINCFPGWSLQYAGYLMSSSHTSAMNRDYFWILTLEQYLFPWILTLEHWFMGGQMTTRVLHILSRDDVVRSLVLHTLKAVKLLVQFAPNKNCCCLFRFCFLNLSVYVFSSFFFSGRNYSLEVYIHQKDMVPAIK